MPKKMPDSENNLEVQKSNPLTALWRSDLTLAEFKILDTYLGRINSHDPDHCTVVFKKGELEKLLGVTKINIRDMKTRLKNLGTPVMIEDHTDKKDRIKCIPLFEEITAERGNAEAWQVRMTASRPAMKYFFNIENLGYIHYKLRCITEFQSRQAYILFVLLEKNKNFGSVTIALDELKTVLSCEKEDSYKQYKRFNDLVLKRIQKEINEKTDCKFHYEPIRTGRKVSALRFVFCQSADKIAQEDKTRGNSLAYSQASETIEDEPEPYGLWKEALKKWNPTKPQYNEIFSLLITVPEWVLPHSSACYDSLEIMQYHYLDQKVKEIERRTEVKPIRDKAAYLVKMVKQDIAQETERKIS